MVGGWVRAESGGGGEVKENYPEREALRLRWAVLALAGSLAALVAAAALDARLPAPLMRHNGSRHQFIAENAYEHLVNLTSIGPRVAGSYQNEVVAVGRVVEMARRVAAAASPHNHVELDVHTASGAFPLAFIDGMSHMYRDVQSVVVRVRGAGGEPRGRRAARSALLLNCHYDTVPDSPGASDDGAGCAVVLETLRALAASPRPLRHDVLALLNGAEENVLQASHAFVTSHPWAATARAVVNLEACGSGGREVLFQAGPEPWLVEVYAAAAPHPFASSLAQELFQSGLIPADTDFRIFRDFGNLSGVDLAWSSNGYVYHTRLDTADRIPLATLQRTGDNVLALAHALLEGEWLELAADRLAAQPVFFDVLGLLAVAARAPAAAAAVLATLALLLAAHRLHAREARQQLHLPAAGWRRAVVAAGGAALAGGAAGLAAAALPALALHAARRRLAFYARPALLAPLYAAPGVSIQYGLLMWSPLSAGGVVGGGRRAVAAQRRRRARGARALGGARLGRRHVRAARRGAGRGRRARAALRVPAAAVGAAAGGRGRGGGRDARAARRARRAAAAGRRAAGAADRLPGARLARHVRAHHGPRRHLPAAARRDDGAGDGGAGADAVRLAAGAGGGRAAPAPLGAGGAGAGRGGAGGRGAGRGRAGRGVQRRAPAARHGVPHAAHAARAGPRAARRAALLDPRARRQHAALAATPPGGRGGGARAGRGGVRARAVLRRAVLPARAVAGRARPRAARRRRAAARRRRHAARRRAPLAAQRHRADAAPQPHRAQPHRGHRVAGGGRAAGRAAGAGRAAAARPALARPPRRAARDLLLRAARRAPPAALAARPAHRALVRDAAGAVGGAVAGGARAGGAAGARAGGAAGGAARLDRAHRLGGRPAPLHRLVPRRPYHS